MTVIQRARRNAFVDGWCKLFDGAVQVLSLGLLFSCASITLTEWRVRRLLKRRARERNA